MPLKDPVKRAIYYQKYHKVHNVGSHRRRKKVWYTFLRDSGLAMCSICGYDKCIQAIDFHHKDHSTKEYNIAHITSRAFTPVMISRFLKEMDKCIIVCANCHREIHEKEYNTHEIGD